MFKHCYKPFSFNTSTSEAGLRMAAENNHEEQRDEQFIGDKFYELRQLSCAQTNSKRCITLFQTPVGFSPATLMRPTIATFYNGL